MFKNSLSKNFTFADLILQSSPQSKAASEDLERVLINDVFCQQLLGSGNTGYNEKQQKALRLAVSEPMSDECLFVFACVFWPTSSTFAADANVAKSDPKITPTACSAGISRGSFCLSQFTQDDSHKPCSKLHIHFSLFCRSQGDPLSDALVFLCVFAKAKQ